MLSKYTRLGNMAGEDRVEQQALSTVELKF